MAGTEPIAARTEDGFRLVGDRHLPARPAGAVAVLGHAMWVDRRTMDRPRGAGLASALVERGVEVLSFDLRGHGDSRPHASEGARFSYDEFVRFDVPAVVAEGRRVAAGRPVTVVGHSLTGHAAMIAAGLFPDRAPDAIVGVAANVWLPRFTARGRLDAVKRVSLGAWAVVTAARGHFDARRFRLGSSGVPWAYVKQYRDNYRRDELRSVDRATDYLGALARVALPVLSIASEGDRLMCRPEDLDRFLDAMPRARITRRVVSRAEIDPPPDHMGLVVRPECRALWDEIADFVLARRELVEG